MERLEPQPLCHRLRPMGFDVADAIDAIVKADGQGPPIGITREQVAGELARIATTYPETHEVAPLSLRLALENFFSNELKTSSVFQSGYEVYVERTNNRVVPTTDYF